MKFRRILIATLFIALTSAAHAQYEDEGWRFKPQIGLWFGPVTPFPGSRLAEVLDTNLGGGLFFRGNLPTNWLRTEIGFSYSYYSSEGPERLHSVPIYGALSYTIPIELPLTFQIKGGGGSMFVRNRPEGKRNWLPTGLLGFETSFPAGKWVNIGLRIDYFLVYEQHLNPPPNRPDYDIVNGHLLNFGLMVNFNLTR